MIGILILTVTSFILSIILTIANIMTDKTRNIKEEELIKLLPGLDCGGCGFGSCKGMASKMINEDIDSYKNCRVLRGAKLEELEKYLKSIKK